MTTLVPTQKNGSLPRVLEDFFNDGFLDIAPFFAISNQKGVSIPNVNVIENTDNFEIELAAPGLQNKDFKAELNNGVLHISAQREEQFKEDDKNFRKREFCYTSFSRSFVLPENVATDKIDAVYKNGVLRITLPKKNSNPETPAKQIKIT
jgi:HSP20 family protein